MTPPLDFPVSRPLVLWRIFGTLFLAAGLGAGGLGGGLYFRDMDAYVANEKVLAKILPAKRALLADLERSAQKKQGRPGDDGAQWAVKGVRKEIEDLTTAHEKDKRSIESYMMVAAGGVVSTVVGLGCTVFYALRLRRWKKQRSADNFAKE